MRHLEGRGDRTVPRRWRIEITAAGSGSTCRPAGHCRYVIGQVLVVDGGVTLQGRSATPGTTDQGGGGGGGGLLIETPRAGRQAGCLPDQLEMGVARLDLLRDGIHVAKTALNGLPGKIASDARLPCTRNPPPRSLPGSRWHRRAARRSGR